jgi:hypothetical protein
MKEQKSIHPGTKINITPKNQGTNFLVIIQISKIRGTNLYE